MTYIRTLVNSSCWWTIWLVSLKFAHILIFIYNYYICQYTVYELIANSSMPLRIAIDLDETLSNTMQAFFSLHNWHIWGKQFKREEITHYHISQIQGVLLSDAQQGAMTQQMFVDHPEQIIPRAGAKECLQAWHRAWHLLYVITWRPYIFAELTKARIEKYFSGLFEDIFMCNYFFNQPVVWPQVTKAQYCERIGAQIMVDDDPWFAQNTASHGIITYLIDRPWNKSVDTTSYPTMQRVYARNEIILPI